MSFKDFVDNKETVQEGEQPSKGPINPLEIVERTIRANKAKSIPEITQAVVDALTGQFNFVAKSEKADF